MRYNFVYKINQINTILRDLTREEKQMITQHKLQFFTQQIAKD